MSPSVLEGSIETSCSRSGKHEGNDEKWREAAVKRLQGQSGWEALNHRHKSCSVNELKICLWEERSGPSAPCVNLSNPAALQRPGLWCSSKWWNCCHIWQRHWSHLRADETEEKKWKPLLTKSPNWFLEIRNIRVKCQSTIKITTLRHLKPTSSSLFDVFLYFTIVKKSKASFGPFFLHRPEESQWSWK